MSSLSLSERNLFLKTVQKDAVLQLLNSKLHLMQPFNPLVHFHIRSEVQFKISLFLHWLLIFCAHSLVPSSHLESSNADIKSIKEQGSRINRLLQEGNSPGPRLRTALPARLDRARKDNNNTEYKMGWLVPSSKALKG